MPRLEAFSQRSEPDAWAKMLCCRFGRASSQLSVCAMFRSGARGRGCVAVDNLSSGTVGRAGKRKVSKV